MFMTPSTTFSDGNHSFLSQLYQIAKLWFTNFETQVFDNYIITWDVIADLLLASPNFLSPSNPAAMCPCALIQQLHCDSPFAPLLTGARHLNGTEIWDDLGHGPKETHGPVVDQTNGWPCFR